MILFHAGMGFSGGYVGVDIFFVISGFLITGLIYNEIGAGRFSFAGFWERRARRILPALTVMVLACVIAGWFLFLPDDFEMLGRSAIAQATLVANVFFRRQAGYFAAASDTKPLLHTWSLSVEEQFYLAFPVLIFLACKRSRPFVVKGIVFLLCASFASSVYYTHHSPDKAFFLLKNRAWELLVGALLAILPVQKIQRTWVAETASWAGMALILFSVFFYTRETRFPGVAASLPCLGAVLLIWSNGTDLTSAGKLLARKPVAFVGLISYSLYLWHWPLIVFTKYWNRDGWNWEHLALWQKFLFFAATFALATASWRWVETPFRRRTVFPSRKKIFAFAAASCVFILAIASGILWQRGMPSRFSADVLRFAAMKNDRAFINNINMNEARKGNFVEIGAPDTNRPVSLLVWGDSHAMAAMPPLAALCREHGWRGIQATRSSTAPVCSSATPALMANADFGDAVMAFIATHPASNVVLIARWEIYPLDEKFKSSLLQTVARLRKTGARVWIMKQTPTQPQDVPRAAAQEVLAGRNPERLGVPLKELLEKRMAINEFFNSIGAAGATVLDPTEYLLNSNSVCLAVADGHCLYADAHHLSVHGAMRLKPLFKKIFSASPPTDSLATRNRRNDLPGLKANSEVETRTNVASGVSPDVEPWRPARRKK